MKLRLSRVASSKRAFPLSYAISTLRWMTFLATGTARGQRVDQKPHVWSQSGFAHRPRRFGVCRACLNRWKVMQ